MVMMSNRDPLDPTPPVGVTRGLIRHTTSVPPARPC